MAERTIDRALQWAREKGMNQTAFGRAIGQSPATITNWKARGMPAEFVEVVADAIGCSTDELLGRAERSPTIEGARLRGEVAHPLSLSVVDAPLVEWEQLMEAVPPAVFRVFVPDEALAPELAAGDELLIDRGVQPAAGDLVLVKDSTGAHYVRVYRQRRPGEWSAHALHPDIEPLEVARDGLEVVGVCVEERRRRRRSGVK